MSGHSKQRCCKIVGYPAHYNKKTDKGKRAVVTQTKDTPMFSKDNITIYAK